MPLTNAAKQAAWRRRRDQRIELLHAELEQLRKQSGPAGHEVQRLRAEVAALQARLRAAEATQASTSSGDGLHEFRRRLERLARQVPRGDPSRKLVDDALAYLADAERRLRHSLRQLDKKLAAIPREARRRKAEALAARPGTEGERAAALAALKRLEE